MIIYAALGENQRQYLDVSQLHPLDDSLLGVPALSANRHAHGILYVHTSVGASTTRNLTQNDNHRFYTQTIAKILAAAPADKEIEFLIFGINYLDTIRHCLHTSR
jgi:hypothetical protein